jgi:hypothetical protein
MTSCGESPRRNAMNKYGQQARTYWETERPEALSQIPDPTEFFSTLGQQIQDQVIDLSQQLAGPDPTGEGYLEKVGRLNSAKKEAEEIVMNDLVYSQEPEEEESEEDGPSEADQLIHQLRADLND